MSAPRDVPPSFWEYLRKGNYALGGSAPSAHVHPLADLTGFGAAGGYVRSSGTAWARVSGVAYADLTGVPSTFAPSAHIHSLGDIAGFGAGVATALGVNVGSAGAFVVLGGALGTPSSGSAANLTSFPTLNQSTTGNAATATALATARTIGGTSFDGTANIAVGLAATATILATARAIYGNNFDGSAALTQIITSVFGGTGNGFTRFSGPTTAERVKTLRDVSDTILELGGNYTPGGTWTNLTLVNPVLGTPASGIVTNLTGTASININGTVGATTPATGAFTTLTTSGGVTTGGGFLMSYNYPLFQLYDTAGSLNNKRADWQMAFDQLLGRLVNDADSAAQNWMRLTRSGNSVSSLSFYGGTSVVIDITSTGFAVTGTGTISGGFGCNTKAAQTAYASGGLLAGVVAALVANGILSN